MAKTIRISSIAKLKLDRKRERRWSGCRITESKTIKLGISCVSGYPPRIPLWATRYYLHACANCSVPMNPTKSKKYALALNVINEMGVSGHALSGRQRAPHSVYAIASGVRAPPHVGRSRVKGGIAAFGRRPWVGARQGPVTEEIGSLTAPLLGRTWSVHTRVSIRDAP